MGWIWSGPSGLLALYRLSRPDHRNCPASPKPPSSRRYSQARPYFKPRERAAGRGGAPRDEEGTNRRRREKHNVALIGHLHTLRKAQGRFRPGETCPRGGDACPMGAKSGWAPNRAVHWHPHARAHLGRIDDRLKQGNEGRDAREATRWHPGGLFGRNPSHAPRAGTALPALPPAHALHAAAADPSDLQSADGEAELRKSPRIAVRPPLLSRAGGDGHAQGSPAMHGI